MSGKLDELTELARIATRKKLEELKAHGYSIPEHFKSNLGMEISFDGDNRIFELVVAGETPQDAKVLTSVAGSLKTMEIQEVNVSLDFFVKK